MYREFLLIICIFKHMQCYFFCSSITLTTYVKNQYIPLFMIIYIIHTLLSNLYVSWLVFHKFDWKIVRIVDGLCIPCEYVLDQVYPDEDC